MKHLKSFLIASAIAIAAASPIFAQSVKEGKTAPDFSITLSTGQQVKLSDYKGKAVLLHFWATWCGPCRVELPEMNAFASKLDSSSRIAFLAVCISDTEKSQSAFMKKNNKIGYTIVHVVIMLLVLGEIAESFGRSIKGW